ncbi:hypothetical protein FHX82_006733 [Amycolatopsis bartoniae]|uniref:Uncharacterized protein n=1 Tax=Amycolatopsis bartoniae TaxID=941986 RepID=A0A8H9ITH3_9PSEU|nr:hypothetical protein [Amycolatopsis bartoniae]MBB2939647.1 hypothetical protein [Amycolatopsis bartoniae]TVT08234.1 hypothetical protein FNH07_13655 [Amycolatopsis bartoniae]GHF39838.1 hypothetical protein GCM10017566_11500 [Amycolatopsis bartoniae]
MGLENVWIRTLGDGLVRADQVIGIGNHRTPALAGKPGRWLVTISVAAPSGHGTADSWNLTNLHRTLAQVDREPRQAPDALARLLAQLATVETAGVVNPVTRDGDVRFEFSRFDSERPQAEPEPAAESRIPVGIG